ncbi:hypothetical protein [Novosphingobium sp.]|uniref:hypothetical protein n=1 Tax=Novosphingobium sp. TaxID=1874826 RepID=UPI001EBE7BB9|nr:hypothetical protein [Novosphingobium sp.]MBK9009982.1 hypothetical protein [Novosphingobium sp.]
MAERYAQIKHGVVTNIVLADAAFAEANQLVPINDHIGIGWLALGDGFIPPPPSVPDAITMRQARLVLLGAGLLGTVDAAISQVGGAAEIEWEYAQEVQRHSQLVQMLAPALGLSQAQVDALFIQGAAL